ncbi:SUN domain-containing protein 1-like [Venturia canescens]|uniref:SUN domain-containing protein 1-like n=1 Tax=Venturia canescens TaxID=32260 RepID=UPI001C9C0538|nr:SUN domain-containing protein 1-like [Venturia canescens]
MPNMSRPSIHSDGNSTSDSVNSLSQQNLSQRSCGTRESYGESLDEDARETIEQNRLNDLHSCRLRSGLTMGERSEGSIVYKKTLLAQYKSRREVIYGEQSAFAREERYGMSSQVDSDTELDEAITLRTTNREKKWRIRQWMEIIWRTLVTWIYSFWQFVNVRILRRKTATTSHEYYRYRESKWKKALDLIDRLMQYFYFLMVRILYLDTWLLSRATSVRQRSKGRRSGVIWLIFLPPLLLAGFWLFSNTLNSIKPFSITGFLTQGVFSPESKILKTVANDQSDGEEHKILMESLLRRVEKLESAETSKVQNIEYINQSMDQLRKDNTTIWEHYGEKLHSIEENLDKKSEESSSEIRAIKLELQSLRELYGTLKTCCDQSASTLRSEQMEEQVDRAVAGYFGDGISKQEMNRIVESLLIASSEKKSVKTGDEAAVLDENGGVTCSGSSSMSDDDVRKIVNAVLKIYDADKTGKVDYALESAGGQVISTRCTQRYNVNTRAFKLLGVTLFYESNNPRTVIQGNSLQPGVCWAFQDFPGYLLIKLRSLITVTGFTLEHVPRSLLPNSEMRSAPRKFNVWGLKDENDVKPVMFGDYEFQESEESLQYFPVQNTKITEPYEFIELRIDSNHGQLEYTCLYRFRVHGIPA